LKSFYDLACLPDADVADLLALARRLQEKPEPRALEGRPRAAPGGSAPARALCTRALPSDGRRDGDEHFPRGFATTWTGARRRDVNEYETFAKHLKQSA
jgi:hypothetical protein